MQKNITQKYTIPKRVLNAEKEHTKSSNSRARQSKIEFQMSEKEKIKGEKGRFITTRNEEKRRKYITQNNTKYQSEFHKWKNITQNTRVRSTRQKTEHKIPQNVYATPEPVLHAEECNTKFHDARARKSKIISNKQKRKIQANQGKYNKTQKDEKNGKYI